jgi:hypothetical protein
MYVPGASEGRYERETECEIKAPENQSYKPTIKQKTAENRNSKYSLCQNITRNIPLYIGVPILA